MGTISYSLYLLHPFIVVFLSPFYSQLYKLNWHSDLSYALCLATTLMLLVPLAILTYNFIETPGIKLGGKIIKSMSSKILY
jgi:peptidoglycan/LPS O-acetylase OafA/YrhL